MRRLVCLTVFLLFAWWAWAQDEEVLRAARFLSGASSDEEVDAYWVSQLEARQGRRIRINSARIRSDGLLTEYQIASLSDYRATAGDILSWEELALVDGFSAEFVAEGIRQLVAGRRRLEGQGRDVLRRGPFPGTYAAGRRFQRPLRAGALVLERLFHEQFIHGGCVYPTDAGHFAGMVVFLGAGAPGRGLFL